MPKRLSGSHLTSGDRRAIDTLLREGRSIRYIATALDCSPSTISREITKHSTKKKSYNCDCVLFRTCGHRDLCKKNSHKCKKTCRNCSYAKNICPDYSKSYCDEALANRTGVCNFCYKRSRNCGFDKYIYDPIHAQKMADAALHDTRSGRNISDEHIEKIDRITSPLIKKGQSIYHIIQEHGRELGISESTLRRMVNDCQLEARALDLRDAVKRKPRRKHGDNSYKTMKQIKEGRTYANYLDFIAKNDIRTVQMDCVEGVKEDSAALLTLHFREPHLQIALIMDVQDSANVVAMLDKLETQLGSELFAECFPLILTDNGHEFADIDGMERSISGGKRTMIFFCEPNRSDEKGACENNHKYIRYIIPKGTSLEPYHQGHINFMMDHINSFKRKSLNGNTPYQVGKVFLPEDFYTLMGLTEIPADEVELTPRLLKYYYSD